MEGREATSAVRELRLYQAEHLLRQYGFAFEELPFEDDGNLPLDVSRAGSFLTLRGHGVAVAPPPRQLRLFPAGKHLPQAAWKTATPPCAYR